MADFFSRNPKGRFESKAHNLLTIDVLEIQGQTDEIYDCSAIEIQGNLRKSLKNLVNLQRKDDFVNDIDRMETLWTRGHEWF